MDYQIAWIVISLILSLHRAGYVETIPVPGPPDEGGNDAVTSSSSVDSPSSTQPQQSSSSPSLTATSSVSNSQSVKSSSSGISPQPTSGTVSQVFPSTSAASTPSPSPVLSASASNTLKASASPSSSQSATTVSASMSSTTSVLKSPVSSPSTEKTATPTVSGSVSQSTTHTLSPRGTSTVVSSLARSSFQTAASTPASTSQTAGVSVKPSQSVSTSLKASSSQPATSKTSSVVPASETTSPLKTSRSVPPSTQSTLPPTTGMASPLSTASSSKLASSPSSKIASTPSPNTASSPSATVAPSSSTKISSSSSSKTSASPSSNVGTSPSSTVASSASSKIASSSSTKMASSSSITAQSSTIQTSSSMAPSPSPSPSPSPPRPDKVYYARFKVVAVCSSGIKENDASNAEFVQLKGKVIAACRDAFKADSTFKNVELLRFDCGSVIPQLKITKSGNAAADANVALKPLSDRVTANTLPDVNVNSQSFSAASTAPPVVEPNLYIIMELLLSNNEFCPNLKDFKNNVAKRVFKADGTTNISPSQVVVFQNECNNLKAAGTEKAKPRFYIAQENDINTPDTTLTKRAHELIAQYIKDGTTSRLGAAFDGKVVKVSYGGKDAPEDDKLSDLAIVFIAIGATVGFLLLVILAILMCRGACKSEKPSGSKKPKEVKMTNPIYMDDGVGGRDNPALALDDEGKKGTNDKIKIDENDYEYPTGPANGSAPRNGVTHAEVNSNNNEGYVDMEPAEYQPLEDVAPSPVGQTELETPPPDYQELNAVEPEKKEADPIPKEYIEFTELPSSEEPSELQSPAPSESQSPEPVVIVLPEAPVEATPEEAPLVAEAPPMVEAEEPPKVAVDPEEEPKEAAPPAVEVEYSLPPPPPAPEPEEDVTVSLPSLSTGPIGTAELAVRKDDVDLLKKEFESIEYSLPDTSIYPPALIEKNRYPSIVPRPETRVVIPSLPMTINSDYINANYVRDSEGNKAYIATQGPLQGTAIDFWRMVWDRNTSVVVMVSPLIHMGMEKCFQYWPPDSISRRYGDIDVQLKKKELRPDFTVTTMTVKQGSDIRELVLYRFMTWPEDAIPENAKSAVTFLLEVRKRAKVNDDDPLVVHCSDGVGVTGAFIAIDIGMRCLDQNKTVNIMSIVRSIREDRSGAVQTLDQYRFIYQALYEYAVIIGSSEAADALQKAKSNNNNATSKM